MSTPVHPGAPEDLPDSPFTPVGGTETLDSPSDGFTPMPASTGEPDALVGAVIEGRYELVELIAASAMSRVYRAVQSRLNRQIAIKLLTVRDHIGHIEMFRKRFEREASALARLNHPNIVRVFDHGTYEGMPFLAMEFIPGQTLRTYYRHHPITPRVAIEIVDQVARALAEAHDNGIVHRDVKPANIFVDGAGTSDLVVRLVDFGIAKDTDDNSELTGVDNVLGTPWYMAPEQAMGEAVDGRTDLYALGVVLHRLLVGRTPFSHLRGAAVLVAHINAEVPPFARFRPDHGLPEALEWTVRQSLAKSPGDRFRDARELRKALQACRLALARPELDLGLGLVDGQVETSEDVAELMSGTQFVLTRRLAPAERSGRKAAWWMWALPLLAVAAVLALWLRSGPADTPAVLVAPEPVAHVSAPAPPPVAVVPVPASVEGAAEPEPEPAPEPEVAPAAVPVSRKRSSRQAASTKASSGRTSRSRSVSRSVPEPTPEPPPPPPVELEPAAQAEPSVESAGSNAPEPTEPVGSTAESAPSAALSALSVDAVGGKLRLVGTVSGDDARPLGYLLDGDGSTRYVVELPGAVNGTGLQRVPLASELAKGVRLSTRGDRLIVTIDAGSAEWGMPALRQTADGFSVEINPSH